ncbi:MAG: cysteine desulfurase [Acidimicrobiia bacterium]|nr:cysteine desulfurase [Acidimicrobiia bacterium]
MPDVSYLDHAATTPMRPEAVDAMVPWLRDLHGNPSGSHRLARAARRAVDDARDDLADLLGCRPGEIVFTSGGTEADNLAIFGAGVERGVPVCSAVDHHAVLDPVRARGGRVMGVDPSGLIDLDDLERVLRDAAPVGLVSVLLAGNEVGTVQDLDAVRAAVDACAPGALLHTDAVQAFAWTDIATRAAAADLVSITGHKFGGPMGVGALVVREPAAIAPMLLGGGQERDRRSGSTPVPAVVGLAAGARACAEERKATIERVAALRDRLADGLLAAIPGAVETADRAHKVASNCHLCIPGVEAEALLFLLDQEGVCASAASSCASGAAEPSHVLSALGVPPSLAAGSLRLSLGWTTTAADVTRALEVVPPAVARLRS